MGTIFIPTAGPGDWRCLLADPNKHWRTKFSAKAITYCWEAADGFPTEISQLFQSSEEPTLRTIKYLMAFPEWKVSLPGGPTASPNDLFVLGKTDDGLVTIMIEGKVSESFGPTVGEWLAESSQGKNQRLDFLQEHLGLSQIPAATRYQLLHRTASALIEANRFAAKRAVMIVQSFSKKDQWFEDYQAFLQLFGVSAEPGQLVFVGETQAVKLSCGWARGNLRYLKIDD